MVESGGGAAATPAARSSVLQRFKQEDFEATGYARAALGQSTAQASNAALEEGLAALETELRDEVISRHDELLEQVGSLQRTETSLAGVRGQVAQLQAALGRVRAEMSEPYRAIAARTRQLAALSSTVDLLRRVLRALKLVAKLREHMGSSSHPDLAKAAKLLADIRLLQAEGDLSGVAVVDAEAAWLEGVGRDVRAGAEVMLRQGMAALSQAEVGSALQVYYNLSELQPAVRELQARYVHQMSVAMGAALDPAKISAVSAAAGAAAAAGGGAGGGRNAVAAGGAARWQQALWTQLAACLDAVHGPVVALWHLQRVLAKKRDPFTHVCFLDLLLDAEEEAAAAGDGDREGDGDGGGSGLEDDALMRRVWAEVVKALESTLNAAFHGGSGVKEALALGYPRLSNALDMAFEKIVRDTDVKGVPPAVRRDDRLALHGSADVFCQAYLSRVQARLTAAAAPLTKAGGGGVSGGGGGGGTPGGSAGGGSGGAGGGGVGGVATAEVARFVAVVRTELDAAGDDARVAALVAETAAAALAELGEAVDAQLATGPEARQVATACTPLQARNLSLVAGLQAVAAGLAPVAAAAGASSPVAADALYAAIKAVGSVASAALTPLFKAVGARLEGCLLKMHAEGFGDTAKNNTTDASKYMEETVAVLSYFAQEFLQPLGGGGAAAAGGQQTGGGVGGGAGDGGSGALTVTAAALRPMAARLLTLFVRHAAMVRPLSESGKLRLAKDTAELEAAVAQHLCPVESLGAPYRALRAFRPLLFVETEAVPTSALLADLPPSAVLHHLYSRAPPQLASPHARAGLSAAQYSAWMDQHSERETWKGVKGTLDAYSGSLKASGAAPAAVHGVMLTLGSSLAM